MIQVAVTNRDGRPGRPFNLRVTEEEFENMQASSNRQYERRQWPEPGHGTRWEPAGAGARRGYDNPYVDDQEYYANHEQQRRAQEAYQKAKKAQEEAKAKAEEEERKKQRQREKEEHFRNMYGDGPNFAGADDHFRRGQSDYDRFFRAGFNEDWFSGPPKQEDPTKDKFFWDGEPVSEEEFNRRQAAKERGSTKNYSRDQLIKRLGELAQVPVPEFADLKALYRKAMRKCHPDTGGSHELWVELEEIAAQLDLVKIKKPARG
jgi:hypothetical protein